MRRRAGNHLSDCAACILNVHPQVSHRVPYGRGIRARGVRSLAAFGKARSALQILRSLLQRPNDNIITDVDHSMTGVVHSHRNSGAEWDTKDDSSNRHLHGRDTDIPTGLR